MFGRADITLGIGQHSSSLFFVKESTTLCSEFFNILYVMLQKPLLMAMQKLNHMLKHHLEHKQDFGS